jgi:two-component system sensor histidine kinase ChvG
VKSLRWKLILTTLVVVFIPIYFLNRYAIRFFDEFTRTALEDHLKHYAFLAGEQWKALGQPGAPAPGDGVSDSRSQISDSRSAISDLKSGIPRSGDAATRFAELLGAFAQETGIHLRIVSTNRVALHDSHPGRDPGFAERPEIAAALRGGYSARSRLTPDRGYMYYYIARPVKDTERRTVAVAYVVAHTNPIIRAINRLLANQRRATWLALAVAAVASGVVALTLTRRLRRLTGAARDYAAGHREFTVRIRGRDEVAELAHAARQMADEIQTRNRYNQDFVTTTFHELRTPLTAIQGAVELLEQGAGEQPDQRARFLRNIRVQAARLARLVGELRELTRLDTGLLRGQKTDVEYGAFVREVLDRLDETFDEPHAARTLETPPESLPLRIVPERIEQALSNLIENAYRYTPPEGRVTVRVERKDRHTVLTSVRDTGVGIAAANLPRVFDRFFTTEPKDRPREYGSGLGLAIAKTIVENHGGCIWVESIEGQGACFTFSLPA